MKMRGFSGARAGDDVTSSSVNDIAAAGQQNAAVFATTHWSLVLDAQGESPAAHQALEKLCRIYWRPMYSFRYQKLLREEIADTVATAAGKWKIIKTHRMSKKEVEKE